MREHWLHAAEIGRAYEEQASYRRGAGIGGCGITRIEMVCGTVAGIIPGQHAAVGVCQDVNLLTGVLIIDLDALDQFVQAGHGSNIVETPVVQVDVVIPLFRRYRFTRLPPLVAAGTFQGVQDLAVKIPSQTLPENTVGLDAISDGIQCHFIDFDFKTFVAAEQQLCR